MKTEKDFKAYNQGVQDEAQRIAQGPNPDQENDIF